MKKISQGFCFEGRTREALTWAALNSDIQSFDDTMAHYIHKEYLPYMMVMTEKSLEELMIESDVINSFIMKRHKNDSCIPHETYAPDGKITLYGVKRYLKNILFIEKEEDNRCIEEAKNSVDQRIDELLKNKNAPFRFLRSMTLIDYKIHALEDLKARLGSCALLSDVSVAAKEMEALYPKVNAGFFSKKTKELTDRFERYDDTLVLNR
ncbi:MAG: hypothetical protein LRY69_07185 [Gammaproteobacteria bacterium]|nr:hypothetical protein [Gammaproteobacteria bacterium]